MIGGNQIADCLAPQVGAVGDRALGAQELKLKNERRVRPADDDRVTVLQHHVVRRLTHTDFAVANDRSAAAAAIDQDDSPLNPVDAEMFAGYVMAARLAAIKQIEIVQRWCMSEAPIELHLQFVEPAEARLAAEVEWEHANLDEITVAERRSRGVVQRADRCGRSRKCRCRSHGVCEWVSKAFPRSVRCSAGQSTDRAIVD